MSDKAERLHTLISRLNEHSEGLLIDGTHASQLPLWLTFEPLSNAMGFEDYSQLRDQFVSLCAGLREEIAFIPLRKESVRDEWKLSLGGISGVFDAENFRHKTDTVFRRCFKDRPLTALDAMSERFQADGVLESTQDDLDAALTAVRGAVDEIAKSKQIDERVVNILRLHLKQMEDVYRHYQDFGDDLFWKTYKQMFATFAQLHPIIAGLENEHEIREKLKAVWEKLASKTIGGLSIGADAATLAASLPLLLA